jgi:polyisoprenoid-binding protein YceI
MTFVLALAYAYSPGSMPADGPVYLISRGSIHFVSEAPYETIRGSSDELKGAIDAGNRTFAFTVRNRSIKGFNSPLQQEHFYENYIEADKYPASSFEGKIIEEIDFQKEGEYTVRAKGILNIHGVPQERIIKSTLRIRGGHLFVTSHFTILLEEHQITIPRIVYQKISKEIAITVEAEFIPKKP